MFSNLIESTSHRRELKRRGSFLFITMAAYALLFVVAGVVSIQAVDARLDEQNVEIVTMMSLVDLPPPVAPPTVNPTTPSTGRDSNPNQQNVFQREIQMSDTGDPRKIPEGISAEPNRNLPMPPGGIVISGPDSNPSGVGNGPGGNSVGGSNSSNNLVVVTEPPPDVPAQKPPSVLRKSEVINGDAISLPKPPYPEIAKKFRAQGTVAIQVLIDITGKVVSAQVVSGHPLLAPAARNAAYQARFSPTTIGNQPVKVSGVITYNFVLNQ